MKEVLIIVLFIIGFIFCCTNKYSDVIENFDVSSDCPNYLIQKGNEIHLLNKNKALIPGVNPIRFNNLEGYIEFLNWQRKMGIHCPVLYFQQTYDAQNNVKYRMLPDITEKNAGLPSHIQAQERPLYDANHDDAPYNVGSFPGFDAQDQYIGVYTPLDKMYHSGTGISGSPMDVNWGGPQYSRNLVKAGVYGDHSDPNQAMGRRKEIRNIQEDPTTLQRHLAGVHGRYGQQGGSPDESGEYPDEKYYTNKFRENKRQYKQYRREKRKRRSQNGQARQHHQRQSHDDRRRSADHKKHHEDHHKKHHEDHHHKQKSEHQKHGGHKRRSTGG